MTRPLLFYWRVESTGILPAYSGDNVRKKLALNKAFAAPFSDAKVRISSMQFRFVTEDDPVRQTLLEVYCAGRGVLRSWPKVGFSNQILRYIKSLRYVRHPQIGPSCIRRASLEYPTECPCTGRWGMAVASTSARILDDK